MKSEEEEIILTVDNLEYLRKASRVMDCSISDYLNRVIWEDRQRELFDCLKK